MASILAEKFPDSASGILHKGHESETIDFVFSIFSLDDSKWYHQYNYKNNYYPLISFSLPFNEVKNTFFGLIDTGATISAIDKKILLLVTRFNDTQSLQRIILEKFNFFF
ncbi:hypothetical protein LCGC14_1300760 [marine sediment metagenome]|uniref:Uncharacterized protein n=1 Tax=marine sediment metagenome TaxID=412755 RepID=A0A0F9LAC4_9ZZZZ